jgi:hypothetical protein
VEAGHLVVDDRDAHAIVAARNITMSHDAAPEGVEKKQKARAGVQPVRASVGGVRRNGLVSSLPIFLNSPKAAHTSFR